jgi:hypothetical protein
MRVSTSRADLGTAKTWGAYWKALLRDVSWATRRVETISIIDESHVEWRNSLDIDASAVRAAAKTAGLPDDAALPIPLASMAKRLQLDLDVRGPEDQSLSVLVSDEDSFLSHAYFLAEVSDAIAAAQLDGEILRGYLAQCPETFLITSHDIIRKDTGPDLLRRLWDRLAKDSDAPGLEFSQAEAALWRFIQDTEKLRFLLEDLADAYYMTTALEASGPPSTIVKFRLVGSRKSRFDAGTIAFLGIKPIRIEIDAIGIGTAQREHTRFVAPPGTKIVDGWLMRSGETLSSTEFTRRVDPGRLVCYTKGTRGVDTLNAVLVPSLGGFFIPAFLCSLLVTGLALGAWILEHVALRFTTQPQPGLAAASADASAALLALVPTVFAVFLVQNGEHRFVYRLHTAPRFLLLLPALSLFLCAVGIAVSVRHLTLMWLTGSTTVLGFLTTLFYAAVCLSVQRRLTRAYPRNDIS